MIGRQSFPVEDAPAELTLLAEGFESAPLTAAMEKCAAVYIQGQYDVFNSQASPDGDDWLQRKHVGDGHPILKDKGNLYQASVGGGAGHISHIGERELTKGVDGRVIPYAATHNFGRDNIPQREYAGLKPEHEDACEAIIADGLLEVLG